MTLVELYPARKPRAPRESGTAARVVRALVSGLTEAVEFEAPVDHANYVRQSGNKRLRKTHPHLMLTIEVKSPPTRSRLEPRTWSAFLVQRMDHPCS